MSNAEALEFSSMYSKIGKKVLKLQKVAYSERLPWQRNEPNLKNDILFKNKAPLCIHFKKF